MTTNIAADKAGDIGDFVEFTDTDTIPQNVVEQKILDAIRAYLTIDSNPDNIVQRGSDLADKYYQMMVDIGVEFGIADLSTGGRDTPQ